MYVSLTDLNEKYTDETTQSLFVLMKDTVSSVSVPKTFISPIYLFQLTVDIHMYCNCGRDITDVVH